MFKQGIAYRLAIASLFFSLSVLLCLEAQAEDKAETQVSPSTGGDKPTGTSTETLQLKDGTILNEEQATRLKKLRSALGNDGSAYVGDHLKLQAALIGVQRLEDAPDSKLAYCIPRYAEIRVKRTLPDSMLAIRIESLAESELVSDAKDDAQKEAKCYGADDKLSVPWAREGYMYRIGLEQIATTPVSRTGVTFGALLVPFKFYLGSNSALKTAPTVAPYIGYIFADQHSMTYTWFVSGGLGILPVNNADDGTTTSEAAFSTSTGILITSEKNREWSSGLLIGKDWVDDSVKTRDAVLSKAWLSLFIGFGF